MKSKDAEPKGAESTEKRQGRSFEREPSTHKVNAGLEARLRFAGHANMFLASAILVAVAHLGWLISQPQGEAHVYVQDYEHAGYIQQARTVHRSRLGAPVPRVAAPPEVIVEAAPWTGYVADPFAHLDRNDAAALASER